MERDAEIDVYTRDLEQHLGDVLFGADGADGADGAGGVVRARAAVLLVRGALAGDDRAKARLLADATKRLSESEPANRDLAAAAAHARGLVEHDPATLETAASRYTAPLDRAHATEDAALACSERGDARAAVATLRRAYQQYERHGRTEAMARVRSQLRASGVRQRHWRRVERPASGLASLTETERRIADLVSQGLSNREVADQVYLSAHTVAFHLRHIFWKLNIGSRVQLARLVAEQAAAAIGH